MIDLAHDAKTMTCTANIKSGINIQIIFLKEYKFEFDLYHKALLLTSVLSGHIFEGPVWSYVILTL